LINYWLLLRIIRPHIVIGGALAFSLGAVLAIVESEIFQPLYLILGYFVVFLGDLSTHLSNDYFDLESDRQIKSKKTYSQKILLKNPPLVSLAKRISLILFALSNTIAAVMVFFLSAPKEFFIIVFLANLLGWFYSAPPLRLNSRGLGEIAIAIATGFVIPSIGYLSVRFVFDSIFYYFVIPFVMYGFVLALSLSLPHIEHDLVEKKTFAVRVGKRNVFFIILITDFLATITFFYLNLQESLQTINTNLLFLISFIPLIAGCLGFVMTFEEKDLGQFGVINVSSLFLYIIIMILYFLGLNL
jgi:1,4-dihydroxy-2-naphthoate octaprenyltransferase